MIINTGKLNKTADESALIQLKAMYIAKFTSGHSLQFILTLLNITLKKRVLFLTKKKVMKKEYEKERDPFSGRFVPGNSNAAVRNTRALFAVNKLTDEQVDTMILSLYRSATEDKDTVAARVILEYLDRRFPKCLQLELESAKQIGQSMITVIGNVATDEIESDRGTALVNMMSKKLETINVVNLSQDVEILKKLQKENKN